jgi:glycine/D-amino acid oxidase-like deaminating enzyme/nitrite reductase/ring-hydroxylating ferredoxin subunit
MTDYDTTPYWQTTADMPSFPAIESDVRVDVCVVGGGITGLTAAYLLTRAGRRVAVVERATCASVDTGHTTAHVTCVTDLMLTELVNSFGRSHAEAVWDAGLAAIHEIDQAIRRERIDCEFVWAPAYLHSPIDDPSASDRDELEEEARLARELGFDALFLERVPFMNRPGVEFPNQALFHPRKYLAGLASAISRGGSRIFERTAVEEVRDDPMAVVANGRRIACDYVVIATHAPLQGKTNVVAAAAFQTKQMPYSTYAIGGRLPKGRVPQASFWDTADPYHHLRVTHRSDDDYVVFGGEDHKTGQVADTTECYRGLEATLKRVLPDVDVTHRWSGQVIETNDGLPYMGEISPRQFVATGFSGNGMTFGTLAGMMACDNVMGMSNPWRELFDVGRTKIRGGLWDYLKENKDYPYYLIRDRFAGAQRRSLREVPRGEGRIIDLDGERVAAYRADDGEVRVRSAVCTHMGCLVAWNTAERTWDCPCHGSRFTPNGDVIAGPAESPLGEVKSATLAHK